MSEHVIEYENGWPSNERTCFIDVDKISLDTTVKPISNPVVMTFDRFGNIFVIDGLSSPIKKFTI